MRHDPVLHRRSPAALSFRAGRNDLCWIGTVDRRPWGGRATIALAHGPGAPAAGERFGLALEEGAGIDHAFGRMNFPIAGAIAVDDRRLIAVLGRGMGMLHVRADESVFERGVVGRAGIERSVGGKESVVLASDAFWRRMRREEVEWIVAATMPLSVRLEALQEIAESATRRASLDYGMVVLDIG